MKSQITRQRGAIVFNRKSSPYLFLMSMGTLIFVVYFFWNDMNLAAIIYTYVLGGVAATSIIFYWDNRRQERLILKLARDMTFSFGRSGPLALSEGVILDRSSATEDSLILTNALCDYIADVSFVVVKISVNEFGVRAAASIQMKKSLPPFRLRAKGCEHMDLFSSELREEVGKEFPGWRSVDFTGYSAFSENYQVEAVDEREVRHLFSPGVLKFFAMTPRLAVDGGPRLDITAALIETTREFRRWLLQVSDIYNMLSDTDSPFLSISVNYS